MNENESSSEALVADIADEAFIPPDKSLTLKRNRLAGSPACLNCGTALKGPFCYYCGQPDRNFMRFFPVLLREFMEDFLELDSRFARTIKPLLFKPGRLTRDYLEGRRFRYTPPMRLYLFSSIAFFLIAAMLSANAINFGASINPETGEPDIRIFSTDPEIHEQVQEHLEEAGVEDTDEIMQAINQGALDFSDEEGDPAHEEEFTTDQIMINGQQWHRENNPVIIDFMPNFINNWINDEIEESPEKARRIEDDPNLIVEQVFDILPGTMFVLLPVVALLFKFWYLFAKRYYIEHLIFAMHNHSFVFVSLILLLLFNIGSNWFTARDLNFAQEATGWLIIALSIWIPLYLLISLRHVYRQNWFLTIVKFGAIGLSYITLLALVTGVVLLLGFVLL
jgi:hypothetical protein